MPLYDNPAGRLHELLRKLSEQSTNNGLGVSWGHVLGVPANEVQFHISDVAGLVPQIEDAVDRLDDDDLRAPVRRLRNIWMRAILPSDQAFNGQLGPVLPPREALESLALVSKQLHLLASEGNVPEEDRLEQLREQLLALVDEVRQSADLAENLRQAIVARLMDLAKAIEHVHVGGPDAVRLAMEAVAGTVMLSTDPLGASKTTAVKKMWATLGVVWVAFSASPAIHASIEAWPKIVREISSGQLAADGSGAQAAQAEDVQAP